MNIIGLTNIVKADLQIMENGEFFYISSLTQLIPWYSIFPYYFFRHNSQLYVHDFEYGHIVKDYMIDNAYITNVNHLNLLKNIGFKRVHLDKIILFKFIKNAGHAFCNILNAIYKLKDINVTEYKIIVTEDLIQFSSFLMSLIYLFFNKNQIVVIDDKTIVSFNQTIIITDYSSKIDNAIEFLRNRLKFSIMSTPINVKSYKNICLIKSTITTNQNGQNNLKTFSNEYNAYIANKGFDIIIPEKYDICTLFKIIYNSTNVILSWGCCSYLNSSFVNENANVLVLCHDDYQNEYDGLNKHGTNFLKTHWFPTICDKKLILFDLQYELTEKTKTNIDCELNKLIC
jgi:hypothetical protein